MTTPERDGVPLTHLDEPLFDGAGATKRDLVDYLSAVSGLMLPGLRGRPLSVIRVRPAAVHAEEPAGLRAAVDRFGDAVG
jgi:DNA primase